MGIIFLILFSISLVLFVLSIILIFTPIYQYFILALMLSFFSFICSMVFLKTHTKKYPRNEFENYKVKNIKDYIKTENGEKVITFEYKNGLWVCENCDKAIVFDLKGYLFKKSFITAFVIRQIRYATIRNRRAEILLYKMKNEEPKFKSTNLYLQFVLDKKVEKQQIIKNGISKNTFLSYIITNLKIIFFPQKSIAYMKNTIAVCADEEHYRK